MSFGVAVETEEKRRQQEEYYDNCVYGCGRYLSGPTLDATQTC